jgi:hypothetical protein
MNWNKRTADGTRTLQNICLCVAYPEMKTRYEMRWFTQTYEVVKQIRYN